MLHTLSNIYLIYAFKCFSYAEEQELRVSTRENPVLICKQIAINTTKVGFAVVKFRLSSPLYHLNSAQRVYIQSS